MKKEYQEWIENQRTELFLLENMLGKVEPPPLPTERKDKPWWPDRFETAGVTAFPLTLRPREYIRDLVVYLKEHGYNSISTGAQAWSEKQASKVPFLPCGPVDGPEWAKNLETMLDETARHENFWVQLIPTFGYKQYDTDPNGMEYEWHRQHAVRIIDIIKANGFEHVYISVMNEYKHPLTDDDIGDSDIYRLGQYIKERTGFPVSADHGGKEKYSPGKRRIWKAYYPAAWRNFDYFNFHPPRNPEPTAEEFEKAYERWSCRGEIGRDVLLLYNETVSFASDDDLKKWPVLKGKGTIACMGRGTEDERKNAIRDIKANIRAAGQRSRFFFHSIWLGIRGGLDTSFGWIPVY